MKLALPTPLAMAVLAALAASASAFGQQATPMRQAPAASATAPGQSVTHPEADNSRMNRRDRNDASVTPTEQSNASAAVDLVSRVRQAIVDDDSLSMKAHNVKVVANNGVVTLRGPVANAQEKARVEQHAAGVRGVTHVDNQLDIATEPD